MIDWYAKMQQLKASADELDLWAGKTEGHIKLVLGRTADELRQMARDIELALNEPSAVSHLGPPPEWVSETAGTPEEWYQPEDGGDYDQPEDSDSLT